MEHDHNIDSMFSLLERIDPQYRQYRSLITERDQGIDKTNTIIERVFGDKLNLDGVVPNPAYYVNNNENTTWRQYILFNLRHTFGLMENKFSKYLPTVAKLAYSDAVRFDIADDNGAEVNTLKRIVGELKKDEKLFKKVRAELSKGGVNPSDVFNGLRDAFAEKFRQADEKDAAEANSVEGNGSEYTVVEVPDFETAKYYGDRSCSESKLCYTQNEGTWNSYTKDGVNAVYVCLRDGWENTPEVATEGNPYDLYGTSMIFVFVNPNGEITCSNCRWNHKTVGEYENGVDHAFTKSTLSNTIGIPFDSVFKPKKVDTQRIAQMIEKGGCDLSGIAVGDFVIPDGVRKIGDEAFYICTGLTSITIPDSVTSIGSSAFYNCHNLTSVTIPDSVTSIGDWAFGGCSGLTSITIPNSLTLIGDSTFAACTGLKSVTIPNSVTSIGYEAFSGCSGLTSVAIPYSVTSIGDYAFYSCTSLTSVNIPNSITKISSHAFYYCTALASVTIPDSVTSISGHAFQYCDALTSVIIPDSVTTIGYSAFDGSSGLKSVNIPDSVTSIGDDAFYGCPNLTVYATNEEHAEMVRRTGFVGKIVVKGQQQNESRRRVLRFTEADLRTVVSECVLGIVENRLKTRTH